MTLVVVHGKLIYGISHTFSVLLNVVLPLIIVACFALAFADALTRPRSQFYNASRSQQFWVRLLGIGGLVYAALWFLPLWIPGATWISLLLIIALVYYLGPERSRLGPRGGFRGGRGSRGGW
ncbi:hypothetical protein [Trueperella sp. LYQ143]|uniref:hypothetical protein n=1 Tax=unclassified Trueperella TaxID=2630174 RepID=UPI003983AD2A